jgi:hypothetical protein
MNFYGRRNSGLHELRDGEALSQDHHACVTQPMVRLAPRCHAFLAEATQYAGDRWCYPLRWFEQHGALYGEGNVLDLLDGCFQMCAKTLVFPINSIVQTSLNENTRAIPICA